ncbi:MAG TPA: LPXTG cell wall anchor domain-containing protein [Mycobacteriales bacterium]|nr:LPXTG cell wall anchor domain-containing protein [Mycobacteriales bacterium]
MRTAGPRIEIIRFSLLVVLTVALASVAVRINSHSTAHTSAPPARTPSTSSASGTPSSTPATSAPTAMPTPTPTSTQGGGSTAGGGPQMLPVTGDEAVWLAGLAALLMAGGAGAIVASRRPRTIRSR